MIFGPFSAMLVCVPSRSHHLHFPEDEPNGVRNCALSVSPAVLYTPCLMRIICLEALDVNLSSAAFLSSDPFKAFKSLGFNRLSGSLLKNSEYLRHHLRTNVRGNVSRAAATVWFHTNLSPMMHGTRPGVK